MALYFNQIRTTKPCKSIFEAYKKQFSSKSSSCKNLYQLSPSINMDRLKDKTIIFSNKNKRKDFQFSSPPKTSISNKRKGNNILITNDIISSPHISKEIKKKFSKVLNDTLSITQKDFSNKFHYGYCNSQMNKIDKMQVKNKEEVMSVLNKNTGFFYESKIVNNINGKNKCHQKDNDFILNLSTKNTSNLFYNKLMSNKHDKDNAGGLSQSLKMNNNQKGIYINNHSPNTSLNHINYMYENSLLNMHFNNYKTNGSTPKQYNRLSSLPSTKKYIQLTDTIPKLSSIANYNYIYPPGCLLKNDPIKNKSTSIITNNDNKMQNKEIKKSISQKCFVNGIEIKDNTRNDVITFRKIDFTNGSKTNSDNGSSYHNSKEKDSVDKQSSFF